MTKPGELLVKKIVMLYELRLVLGTIQCKIIGWMFEKIDVYFSKRLAAKKLLRRASLKPTRRSFGTNRSKIEILGIH